MTRPEDPLFRLTRDAVRWARGAEPKLSGFFYTTDGGVFQEGSGSPTVVCGPGHAPLRAPDEWVSTREYFQSTAIYVRAALETCRPDSEGGGHRLSVAPDGPEPILTLLVKLR